LIAILFRRRPLQLRSSTSVKSESVSTAKANLQRAARFDMSALKTALDGGEMTVVIDEDAFIDALTTDTTYTDDMAREDMQVDETDDYDANSGGSSSGDTNVGNSGGSNEAVSRTRGRKRARSQSSNDGDGYGDGDGDESATKKRRRFSTTAVATLRAWLYANAVGETISSPNNVLLSSVCTIFMTRLQPYFYNSCALFQPSTSATISRRKRACSSSK
jgi:hypothetical protein